LIRYYKLDRKFLLFRFSNKWYYVFSGEILDFPNVPDDSSDVDLIFLDVLSDVSGDSIIYSGQYLDHSLTKDGDIENILLKYPSKKNITNSKKADVDPINSNFLLIPYQSIKNLNVRYFAIEEITPTTSNEQETTYKDSP